MDDGNLRIFSGFPRCSRTLRKRAKKAEKGRKRPRAARHPLSPHLLHPHLRQPNQLQPQHSLVRISCHGMLQRSLKSFSWKGTLWDSSLLVTLVSITLWDLHAPTEIPPPYRETGVALPLSHCVFCSIADYCCYTPTSFCKSGLLRPKERPWGRRGIAEKTCL